MSDEQQVPVHEVACTDGTVQVYSWAPLVPIDAVTEHPKNPNQGDDRLLERLVRRHGFRGEVEVQAETGYVVAGNTRLRVMRALGAESIPALVRPMTDREARERLLSDNRARDLALYDDRMLVGVLQSISDDGDILGSGYDDSDLARLLGSLDTTVNAREAGKTAEERHENFIGSAIRQLILVMGVPEFERAVAILAVARERLDAHSNSEVILALIDRWAEREEIELQPAAT
jgi:ParB-like chromosome segregation protein Spo0J